MNAHSTGESGKSRSSSYDVAILGTGNTGTILGAILARHGVRTVLVEQGVHPRFAIGESTVPETTLQFLLVGTRYDVPEIANLSSFNKVRRNICTTSGVKRNFSFVFHRPDEPLRPEESSQTPTVSPPIGPDVHLFRQDIDAYMLSVAVGYGAAVRQRTDVTEVKIHPEKVELRTRDGAIIEAKYVVDAGGIKAPVAHALGLRHETPKQRTHSRSIYTHMHGVQPFDACSPPEENGLPSPLSQGTLHHIFDGGWMWVIPFDNHPSSTNRLCSVGLQLDPRKHPRTGDAPADEFKRFVSRYPAMKKQFANAVAFRDWTATDRLQFSSERVCGDRFFLMPHAFAFVDPLFSSGLGISMGAINGMAWRLIAAKKDGDYSGRRFEPVEERVMHNFDYFDRLVSCSYVAFSDFEVWNAWYKVWLVAGIYGAAGMLDVLGAFYRSGDVAGFELCEKAPYDYIQASQMHLVAPVFAAATKEIDALERGDQAAKETARNLFSIVSRSNLWPRPWGSPERRHPGVLTVPKLLPLIAWIKRGAPDFVREHYFNRFKFQDVVRMTVRECASELGHSGGNIARLARDFAKGYNDDWRGGAGQ